MSYPEKGNVLTIPAWTPESEQAVLEISWSQSFRTRSARYYIVRAQNQSKSNVDVLVYVQDRFYKEEASNDYIGRLPGARKEGNTWVVTISDRFQYGQKNKNGDGRWVALHDKDNKPYQHRFMVTTIQGQAAEWAKTLSKSFGAGEIADAVSKLGNNFIGDYLHTF
ncbi:hypothetical protein NM208_g5410 [Fusarium decemcellulare]|uniref:Uncharacterized protein n=2 Tax=Fusarium decemcellulare TaxID=57161 RepID=A0ACC1SH17_9HYPO|nr:hypothetical protein NM208_g6977 [Fusarium decemcellulare]KAJ3539635.1 hypothetical protein NM208_g5410 [Fusarium decemcellulare]